MECFEYQAMQIVALESQVEELIFYDKQCILICMEERPFLQ